MCVCMCVCVYSCVYVYVCIKGSISSLRHIWLKIIDIFCLNIFFWSFQIALELFWYPAWIGKQIFRI